MDYLQIYVFILNFYPKELLHRHILKNYTKQKITGIIVNKKPQVDVEYRKKIRQEIYYIKKFGLDSHVKRLGEKDKNKYCLKLLGKIQFVLQINNNDIEFINYRNYVKIIIENLYKKEKRL